jgi:hypothetical protein
LEENPLNTGTHDPTLTHEKDWRSKSNDIVGRDRVQVFRQIIFLNAMAVLRCPDQLASEASSAATKVQIPKMNELSIRTRGFRTFNKFSGKLRRVPRFSSTSVEGEHTLEHGEVSSARPIVDDLVHMSPKRPFSEINRIH